MGSTRAGWGCCLIEGLQRESSEEVGLRCGPGCIGLSKILLLILEVAFHPAMH